MGQNWTTDIAASISTNLTNAYAAMAVGANTTPETAAVRVPDVCELSWVHIALDTIAGASTVTVMLTGDAAMNWAITEEVTLTIKAGEGTATNGAVSAIIGPIDYRRPVIQTSRGTLRVCAKLDAGTANGVARLFFRNAAVV